MHLHSSLPAENQKLGEFLFSWLPDGDRGPQMSITKNDKVLWSSVPGRCFLSFSSARSTVKESRGFFEICDEGLAHTRVQTVDGLDVESDSLVVFGRLRGESDVGWRMRLRPIDEVQLQMHIEVQHQQNGESRIRFHHACSADEKVFGFGAQFTHLDLRGRFINVLSQEPGIGRGVQPLTWLMNMAFGAGGDDTRSNAPSPHYVTSACQSLCLETHVLSRFDLQPADRIEIEVWSHQFSARVFAGDTPAALIEAHTRFCGRMPPLPDWMHEGAVVGMQGGTAAAKRMWDVLREANAPIAAFWLQDWVGARKTSVGSQLWWNWELDTARYPGWDAFRAELGDEGIRILSYVNPFLVDVTEREEPSNRNLFQEAKEAGYLINKADGTPYLVQNTSFSAGMVDLTHPEAWTWLKAILREQVLDAGASGWMADFGEALPFDAQLYDGSDAAQYHNQYPEAWARLNREVIQEAGREGDAVFFTRSGFTRSPGFSTLFWLGDQLTSWSKEDGIRSAVTGLLSSGFSGFSQNHSDIGGYTTTAIPGFPFKIPLLDYRRSPELLQRWIELNAFTAVFRTHEGNQPDRNHQIDDDPVTLAHFARFARLFAALAAYRKSLGVQAASSGVPVVRHPWICHPDDPHVLELEWQFMLGPSFMVAPVLDANTDRVCVYLPEGIWRHLWSDEQLNVEKGSWFEVEAPIGSPAVFFPKGDPFGEDLVTHLDATGDRATGESRTWIQRTAKPQ